MGTLFGHKRSDEVRAELKAKVGTLQVRADAAIERAASVLARHALAELRIAVMEAKLERERSR